MAKKKRPGISGITQRATHKILDPFRRGASTSKNVNLEQPLVEIAGESSQGEHRSGQSITSEAHGSHPDSLDQQTERSTEPSDPKRESTSNSKTHSNLIQATDSLVTFVLTSLKSIGSILPGIGAIDVALAIKDKIKLEASNRKELEDILRYVEFLLSTACPSQTPRVVEGPDIHLTAELIEKLTKVSRDLEITKRRTRADRTLNSKVIEPELKAVWDGISRSLGAFHLGEAIKVDEMLHNVGRMIMDEARQRNDERMGDFYSQLGVAGDATFDSFMTESRIKPCTKGTREQVLSDIKEWATNTDAKRVFWLSGLAGIGKSTIALTVAKWAREETRMLGGSFFFSRDVHDLSDPKLVVITLACQLARFDLGYKVALYDELRNNQFSRSANFKSQFEHLIRKPLSSCHNKRPIRKMCQPVRRSFCN